MKIPPTGYWTFICNPARWEIDKFLISGADIDFWYIPAWQESWFELGQQGVVRVSADRRSLKVLGGRPRLKAGVYALVKVLRRPFFHRLIDDAPFWLDEPDPHEEKLSVQILFLQNLIHRPLLLEDLSNDPQIQDTYLLKGYQASSIPLDPSTFHRIAHLAGFSP